VKRNGFEWIIVLPADHVSKMNLRKLLEYHISKGADVTIAAARVPAENAHRYGIITSNGEGRILEFKEKPHLPAGNLASMGIYVFNRQALLECLADDAAEPASLHDFGYSVIPATINKKKLYAYPFAGYWRDIGTIDSYFQTNMELIDRLPALNAGRKWQVPSQATSLLFHNSYNHGSVTHSLVGPRCVIKGKVENSVLSPDVVVGENAVVKNSIIMAGSSVGEYCYLDNCIVSENVRIGPFCNVGLGRGSNVTTFDTTVIIGPGVAVPAYTLVPARPEASHRSRPQRSLASPGNLSWSLPN
jgi:glucose-1-phosphate adenylyltransferase